MSAMFSQDSSFLMMNLWNMSFLDPKLENTTSMRKEYMAALNKVPRLSREAVDTSMVFLRTFANTISQLSYSNFKLAHLLAERDILVNALRESEENFHTMANVIPQLAWIAHPDGYIYWYNERWYSYTGATQEQMEGWGWQCSRPRSAAKSIGAVEGFDYYGANV